MKTLFKLTVKILKYSNNINRQCIETFDPAFDAYDITELISMILRNF